MSAPNINSILDGLDAVARSLNTLSDAYEKERPAEDSPKDLVWRALANALVTRAERVVEAISRLRELTHLPHKQELDS